MAETNAPRNEISIVSETIKNDVREDGKAGAKLSPKQQKRRKENTKCQTQ